MPQDCTERHENAVPPVKVSQDTRTEKTPHSAPPGYVLIRTDDLNTDFYRQYARTHHRPNRPLAIAAHRIGQALNQQENQ